MPGWSWFLIGGVLLVALVLVVVLLGRRAWRKGRSAFDAYGELTLTTAELERALDQLEDASAQVQAREYAVFGDRDERSFAWGMRRAERAHRRQARRDARVARGRLLTHSTQNWTS
ncbi:MULTISPECIES: hypothetical protein [unclassified Leifsonia]|uniref:hypothetical protein n=1 Tax=unclassified Leifsonia TaxID=2663824 RepID=UPI0006F629AE|nr:MULTISPECIES: hypothetical protein [unclassified Leifsonia]KQX06984.1 hypothetical protein ASC59_04015 [Leifsonia sp. Root1293]KRA11268.1 hypothetical protein ASD61_04015 [Leifsonia sp. Root60]